MDDLVITVYELATLLVPFLVAYAVVRTIASRTGRTTAGLLPGLVFAFYVFAVLYVTGVGTVYDLADMANGTPRLPNQVNVVPFAGGITMGTVLNAVMFVPLGFLLPLMWRRGARLAPVVGFGFAFSLAIELTQLLNNRTTDIDDLLMNTLGALVGFVLFKLWERLTTSRERTSRHAAYLGNLYSGQRALLPGLAEPARYLAVMFVGHFLLFNGMGIAVLLYNLAH